LLTGDILVATTFDKAWAVRGFDAGDGATRWTHAVGPEFASSAGTLPAAITITGMAADDRAIYFTAHTAEVIPSSMLTAWLVALDPSDGHVLWTRQRDGVSGGVITDGAGNVFADLILRSGPEGYGDFRMSALSASGSELWLASNYDGEGTGDPIAVASGLVFPRGDRDAPVHLVDGGDLAYVAPYTPYGPTFAPVFGDNTGFVESVHTSMPFPGDKRAGNTLTTFDLLTGAAIAAVDLSDVPDTDGTEPLVTSRQEILIGTSSPDGASGSTSTLRAFRRDGTVDFACPVDLPEPFTAGGPSPSALVAGTWIVQTGDASMLGHSRLWGFRVPGLELASTGWPVAQGSMQRRNAPPTK
jgi:outer membrane protein assembly factor BamB